MFLRHTCIDTLNNSKIYKYDLQPIYKQYPTKYTKTF